MHKDIDFRAVYYRMKHPAFLLFIFGGTSLIIATLLAAVADISSLSWMRLAANSRLSIICHFITQLLPFLIAAYAVFISRLWLLYAVCSWKLFYFAYMGALIWRAFGSAGWLVRWLLLFSDHILVPMLWWLCFRLLAARGASRDFWVCIGIAVITVLINLLFVSPLLARIINI